MQKPGPALGLGELSRCRAGEQETSQEASDLPPRGPRSHLRGVDLNQKAVGGHRRLGNATCSGLCHQVRDGIALRRCREEGRDVRGACTGLGHWYRGEGKGGIILHTSFLVWTTREQLYGKRRSSAFPESRTALFFKHK